MTAPRTVFVACAMPAASSPANATPPAFASIFDASVAVSATGPGALTTALPDTWASTVLVIVLVEIEPPAATSHRQTPPLHTSHIRSSDAAYCFNQIPVEWPSD